MDLLGKDRCEWIANGLGGGVFVRLDGNWFSGALGEKGLVVILLMSIMEMDLLGNDPVERGRVSASRRKTFCKR